MDDSKKFRYVPYVKYIIAPGTRFERDAEIFFGSKGDVSQGKNLINYGWSQTGFKELIEAFYFSRRGTINNFHEYFEQNIRYCTNNILDLLRKDGLIDEKLRGLIRIDLREDVAIPALLVEIQSIRYKYCLKPTPCIRLWKEYGIPSMLKTLLDRLGLTNSYISMFRCIRQLCYEKCGNYKQCALMYTSVEGKNEIELEIEKCVIELIKQIELKESGSSKYKCRPWTPEDHKKRKIGPLKDYSKCFERPVRFDFKPLRYYILDPATWRKIEKQQYIKNPRSQYGAFPDYLLPYIFDDRFLESTEVSAPLNTSGVLECFLHLAQVRFEIKITLEKSCPICNMFHRIENIPIKAMFKTDDVFRHEAGFAELLWDALWEHYPKQMCESFKGLSQISSKESPVLKRELKVQEITPSPYSMCAYDFAIFLNKLLPTNDKILLFDLTTALWKKSGFHEETRSPEEYLSLWQETLCRIPNTISNVIAVWYIVVNETQDTFFDETAPKKVQNINQLVDQVCNQYPKTVKILYKDSDLSFLHDQIYKLLVVPIFNSTPRRGEARHELKKLQEKRYSSLLIKHVVDFLLTSR